MDSLNVNDMHMKRRRKIWKIKYWETDRKGSRAEGEGGEKFPTGSASVK